MPTDDERREAACMVRSTGNQSPRMWQQIRGMLGMPKDCGVPQIREHLASLIDSEPEHTCYPVFEDETLVCSECGEDIDGYGWNYCPNCGARIEEEVDE